MEKASVYFKNITKEYSGKVIAVDNISCTFEPGSLTTLLGPSGCGKTTSLRLIAGLERATSGSVFIDEEDVTLLPATNRDVSMVFQSYALFPHMNVIENVSYGLKMTGISKNQYLDKATSTLSLVGLAGYEKRMPSELSGGQQQRVAVARAIVLEPKVLLFDEPLSNLDAKLRRQVREDIRELQQELGVTTIYVTHDQEEALAISDKVIVMNNAIIAQEGSPKDLYSHPKTSFVANFIGDANIVKAKINSKKNHRYNISLGGINITLTSNLDLQNEVSVAVRPEAIILQSNKLSNSISAKIVKSSFVGNHYQYTVSSSLGELYLVSEDVVNHYKYDDQVYLTFNEQGLNILTD